MKMLIGALILIMLFLGLVKLGLDFLSQFLLQNSTNMGTVLLVIGAAAV